jgi:hypothetical protein
MSKETPDTALDLLGDPLPKPASAERQNVKREKTSTVDEHERLHFHFRSFRKQLPLGYAIEQQFGISPAEVEAFEGLGQVRHQVPVEAACPRCRPNGQAF